MYELSVECEFCAAHAITIGGEREPMHGHNWRVCAVVQGDTLDSDGLLVDFHAIERDLDRIIKRFDNRCLNETPPFDRINPTAERIATYIAEELTRTLPAGITLARLSISEAPGCTATYIPR